MTQPTSDRRSDIDWLRVIAFSLLIFYHAGMPYVTWDWHIKDGTVWPVLQAVMQFVNRWRLPLLFFIAGATVMLSLGRRSPGAFVGDRLKRILLPLAFGMLVIVPPQVYLQRVQEGESYSSFFAFYPHYFDGVYPTGNFSWHHLWFLAYVLVLALVLLPVWLWMRSDKGAALLDRWSAVAARYYLLWLFVVPLCAVRIWLIPISSNRNGLIGDWYTLAFYGIFMLAGALLYRSPALLQSIERQRYAALAVGVAAYAILNIWFYSGAIAQPYSDAAWWALSVLSVINPLAWVMAFAGFARRWARPTAFLRYATPAVYPFYILHQTVLVIVAFYLVKVDLPVQVKYLLAVIATFGGSALIYEFAVKRIAVLRLLFGMAPQRATPAPLLRGATAGP